MASDSTGAPPLRPTPDGIRESIRVLLKEFDAELRTVMDPIAENEGSSHSTITSFTEAEWLAHLELKFVLRIHYSELLRAVGRSVGAVTPTEGSPLPISATGLKDAILIMDELIEKIEARAQTRLSVTDLDTLPVILRLVSRYKLSAAESDLFQLLFVHGASKSVSFRAVTGGKYDDEEMSMKLCRMSILELEEFLDDKRTHISEGIIVGQVDYHGKTIRMAKEAISALLLRPLNTDQRLKLSKTELLNVMETSKMKSFTDRVVPKTSMDELILSSAIRKRLESIVSFEKARAVLLGQWGFQQEQLGTTCFFWGSHGTGKSAAAEAIGYELGRPLKVINCARLVSRENSDKTSSNICLVFKDARLMDAVLVLEDFQIIASEEASFSAGMTSVSAWSDVAIGLLLHELERFPGICILIANLTQGSTIHRLSPELLRRLKFVVEFKMPDQVVRSQMWKKMIPNKAPIAPDINFEKLGRQFEFASGTISAAVIRAAAEAALRPKEAHRITMKDLVNAAEAEQEHMRDELTETVLRAFV